MEEENINLLKYGIIYSMIVDLLKENKISYYMAEKINFNCSEQLNVKKLSLDWGS